MSMSPITFLGSSALSDFRRKALVKTLNVEDIRARWVHYVALHGGDRPVDFDQSDLKQILTYGEEYLEDEEDEETTTTWFIQPRQGTISPWSSKATSIVEACGLGDYVKRVERGMEIKIKFDGDFDVDKAKIELHDPMTQDLTNSIPDLEIMFGEQ